MTRKPRPTARRVVAEMIADLAARRKDAAWLFREAWERKKARPGYIGEQTRRVVDELLAEVES